MSVQHIEDGDAFRASLNQAGDSLIVIDFFATWCGPCRRIAPVIDELARTNNDVVFLKVDVDKCQAIASLYNIRAMPTFVFIRSQQTLARIEGADTRRIEQKIAELKTPSSDQKSDSGVPGMVDLMSQVNMSQLTCLNESDDHPVKYIFEENADLFLESDCDPELLISIEFNQMVKLHSLKFVAPPDTGPKNVRIYINQPHNLDFDSARDGKAIQELTLTKEDISGDNVVNLKFVKFQNVNNLTIFIADNQGDEETTRIQRLVLIGKTVAVTNMSEFKRVAGKQGESH